MIKVGWIGRELPKVVAIATQEFPVKLKTADKRAKTSFFKFVDAILNMENYEDSSRPLSAAIEISIATPVTMLCYVNHQASTNNDVLYCPEIPYPVLLSLSSSYVNTVTQARQVNVGNTSTTENAKSLNKRKYSGKSCWGRSRA